MATSSDMTSGRENVFNNLEDTIRLVSQKMKDDETKPEDKSSFDRSSYWDSIDAICKLLSIETTKISLAFSTKPYPSNENTEQLLQGLEKCILSLVSAYYSLPVSQGHVLRKHLQKVVLQILDCLLNFTSALGRCPNLESPKQRLQWTGGVWEASDFVILKDNKECVLRNLKETEGLVQDALGEIEEAKESEGQVDDFMMDTEVSNADIWSDHDKEVVFTCEGLVKTVKKIVTKSKYCVTKFNDAGSSEGVATLDDLVELTSGVSRAVDDFVCGIYAPLCYSAIIQNGEVLSALSANIVKFLRDSNLTTAEDTEWLDFLSYVNTHNLNKLKASVVPHSDDG